MKEDRMFYLRYVLAELRRRKGRTVLTSLGLAVGVGLVVTVSALSSGLDDAQSKVLEPLTGVGTDMSVSRPIQFSQNGNASAGPGSLSRKEQKQLQKENGGINFDPSKLGNPGDKFKTTQFVTTDLSFPEKDASKVANVKGVDGVGRALTLNALTISGTVPKSNSQSSAPFGGPPGGAGSGSNTGIDQSSVTGIDASQADLAPVTTDQIVKGGYITASAKTEAMVSQTYASGNDIKVGDKVKVGKKQFKVVGIAKAPLGGDSSDFYVPLSTLQKMSDHQGRINVLQVRADSADDVTAVASKIEATFNGSQVTTAKDLAARVSGSLVDAKNLSSKLGTALAVVALLAAFGIASLLTLSSVNKRTRELGTLKAIGWRQWHVVRQVSGESVAQGLLGGLIGAAIGIGGAGVINALGISLKASVGSAASATPGPFGQGTVAAASSAIPLNASVDAGVLLLAVALAVLGGLIAGSVGGLRAARLRPAEALRSVE
jgi:ABC-type antimicrobial peptide transport system permease subunit